MDLECRTGAYIYYYHVSKDYLQVYINLTPTMVSYLKSWFDANSGTTSRLKYFYQMLDDGQDNVLPDYHVPYLIPWSDRLDRNMSAFGEKPTSNGAIIKDEATNDSDVQNNFATTLGKAIDNTNGYLTVMFEWFYKFYFVYVNYDVEKFKTW